MAASVASSRLEIDAGMTGTGRELPKRQPGAVSAFRRRASKNRHSASGHEPPSQKRVTHDNVLYL
jgi:hypothetical protein